MAQTAQVIRWCWFYNIFLEKSEALYQMQEDIYPIIEEKVAYNTWKGENKERRVSCSPYFIFPSSFYTYF